MRFRQPTSFRQDISHAARRHGFVLIEIAELFFGIVQGFGQTRRVKVWKVDRMLLRGKRNRAASASHVSSN